MIAKRCLALFIDMIIIMALAFIIMISAELLLTKVYWQLVLSCLPFTLFLTKDCFTGMSIGRKAMGISVVNAVNKQVANPWKAYLRNIFIFIWPLELIVLAISNQRIGDMLTKTEVVEGKKTHRLSMIAFLLFFVTWTVFAGIIYFLLNYTSFKLLYVE